MNDLKTNNKTINVRLVYRSYKPIHPIYQSLISNPPIGVDYTIPSVNKKLKSFHGLYRKYRQNKLIKIMVGTIDRYIFAKLPSKKREDLLHFISIVHPSPETIRTNYVIEIEHAMALTKMDYNSHELKKVLNFLQHDKCRAIICLSEAAKLSLKNMLGESVYKNLKDKVNVVYPASLAYDSNQTDYEYITKKDGVVDLLFVGNDCYRKGLQELLIAIRDLPSVISDKLRLNIVSNDAQELVDRYRLKNVKLYPAGFSRDDVIRKMFMPSDVFVFPTKHDTFGMVMVDALAAGLPVIATKQFAIPEIIEDGKNGILLDIGYSVLDSKIAPSNDDRLNTESPDNIDEKIVTCLKKAISEIVSDKKLLINMRKHAQDILLGREKLSIAYRNEKLRKIYEKSLN